MGDYVTEQFANLYKRDSKGKTRVWYMQLSVDGDTASHRTVAGLIDGEKVISGWKTVKGKNVGKANETTAEQQARSEIQSLYTKRRDKGYVDSLSDIDTVTKFDPMLAVSYDKVGVDTTRDVYVQPKLDGIRCIARADGLWTRSGKRIVAVPHIEAALAQFFVDNPSIVLDGELYNHDLKNDFNKIVSLVRKAKPTDADIAEAAAVVEYHIYDMFNMMAPAMTFSWRNNDLVTLRSEQVFTGPIKVVETHWTAPDTKDGVADDIDRLYAQWVEQGYEGQMIRYDTEYQNKRSKNLIKRKEFQDEELVVISMEEGQGNWAGYIKRFIVDFNGKWVGCGVRGDQATLKSLFEAGVTPDWAKVQYFGVTPDGSLRFPVVVDWGFGKRED